MSVHESIDWQAPWRDYSWVESICYTLKSYDIWNPSLQTHLTNAFHIFNALLETEYINDHSGQEQSKPHVEEQKDVIDSVMSPEDIIRGFRASCCCNTVLNNFVPWGIS